MICILSETGLLQCCYLGTEPVSTSIPTIMPSTTINVQDAEEQLTRLNKQIKQAMNDPSKCCVDRGKPAMISSSFSIGSETKGQCTSNHST